MTRGWENDDRIFILGELTYFDLLMYTCGYLPYPLCLVVFLFFKMQSHVL